MSIARFKDRRDAGRQLAAALALYKDADVIVLALPRGGVPVGFEVAKALGAPLDVALVRKLGAPGYPELGIGAIVDGANPQIVLNEDVVETIRPPQSYIDAEAERQLTELERRRLLYRDGQPAPLIAGRTVILIDDGIATGGTVRAVLRGLARSDPARLVLAVPVVPRETIAAVRAEADAFVYLAAPEPFYGVGAHYQNFEQTTDEDVISLLNEAQTSITRESGGRAMTARELR